MEDHVVDTGILDAAANPNALREESGVVTATVTTPEQEAKNAAAVKAAVKAMVALPPLTNAQLVKLARDVATDIKPLYDILKPYNLTAGQFEYMKENIPFFKQALETCTIEWNSPLSTVERIRLQSAAALEEALPALATRMENSGEALNHVVEAGKLFAKLAGLDTPDKHQGPLGEKFSITINLGADTQIKHESPGDGAKEINASGAGGAQQDAPSGGSTTLLINSQGERV